MWGLAVLLKRCCGGRLAWLQLRFAKGVGERHAVHVLR